VVDPPASAYGDAHAEVYDRIYGPRLNPDGAVEALVAAAGPGGRLLELGLGTGRLAVPLVDRGLTVDGIEASDAMIRRLRERPGGGRIGVFRCDLADFDLPTTGYDVAVSAVSTLFMLPGPKAQTSCLASAARHLRDQGVLFVEAFQPDPARYDADGRRVESRPRPDGGTHVVRSQHDARRRCIHITHELTGPPGSGAYGVTLHYATPDELDTMAGAAGLVRLGRWHDWTGTPATGTSTDPVSVYRPATYRTGSGRDELC
jgi:SAM-dependent methyltransferase